MFHMLTMHMQGIIIYKHPLCYMVRLAQIPS